MFFLLWIDVSSEEEVLESADEDCQEFVMSEELQRLMAGDADQISEKCRQELDRYEAYTRSFAARQRALQAKAQPEASQGVHSITPKAQPQNVRVKKYSRFKSSPFDSSLIVTAEQEEIY